MQDFVAIELLAEWLVAWPQKVEHPAVVHSIISLQSRCRPLD